MKVLRICAMALPMAVLLVACGGGGSSTSSGSSSGGSSSPTLVYKGKTTAANLQPSDAGRVTAFMFIAERVDDALVSELIKTFPTPDQAAAGHQAGLLGGTVTYSGYSSGRATTGGTVTETFDNYQFFLKDSNNTGKVNGKVVMTLSGNVATIAYTNYRVVGAGLDETFSGSVVQTTTSDTTGATSAVMDIGVQDNKTGQDWEFSKFTVTNMEDRAVFDRDSTANPFFDAFTDVTASGRLFDSTEGYVDVATQGSVLTFTIDLARPFTGGDVFLTGDAGNVLTVTPLNVYFFAVSSGSDTSKETSSARYNWADYSVDTTPSSDGVSPVASAQQVTQAAVGTPVRLEGRLSHSPSGADVSYRWTLRHVPPASQAKLDAAAAPAASLTPDVPGDYLVDLQVKDGSHTASDEVVVSVPTTAPATKGAALIGVAAGADQVATAGETVRLDGRVTLNPSDANAGGEVYQWTLDAPSGSAATLSDPAAAQPSFVPDLPGYYRVALTQGSIFGGVPEVTLALTVSVGQPIVFSSPVGLVGSVAGLQLTSTSIGGVVQDLDGDGKPDFLSYTGRGEAPTEMIVYRQTGGGSFAAGAALSGSSGLIPAIADLNNDGRPDIVGANSAGIITYLQQHDGTFAMHLKASTSIDHQETVSVAEIGSPAALTVLATSTSQTLLEFPVDTSTGAVGSPVTTMPPLFSSAQFGDINYDGITDIVLDDGIYTGNANGTFTTLSLASNDDGFVDAFGDGHQELVEGTTTSFTIEPETSGGTPITVNTNADPLAYVSGDLDGDGRPEFLTLAQVTSGTDFYMCIDIFYQKSAGSFSDEAILPIPDQANAPIWVGDLDGDGIPDLVYTVNDTTVVQFGRRP